MNPWGLDSTELMVWGLVAHLVADWLFQNEWMAVNKWNLRRPAGWVHAGIHGIALAPVFGWVALPLALAHLLIDTRKPVAWWSRLIRQTQPEGNRAVIVRRPGIEERPDVPLYDIGTEVRFWNDQVWHIACIAVVALVVG